MKKKEAISRLHRQISEIRKVKGTAPFGATFCKWERDTQVVLSNIYKEDKRTILNFNELLGQLKHRIDTIPISMHENEYVKTLEKAESLLESCVQEVDEYWPNDDPLTKETTSSAYQAVERICSKFHFVAKQLRDRHKNRDTLKVTDEYDVQDLIHGLLRVFFDDIRREEWTPSYAGKSSRIDFILKEHGIVIETKMAREGLGAKEIGTQLIDDIHRYKSHPDSKMLVCFVYDPEGRISNPTGIENDLNCIEDGMIVKVLILPRGY
ncbi:MAG: hypothetical protein AB2L11_12295 [Syntrophobacteraceae bacterium]